ncbi:hypothetical protein [Pelagibaculum spongiae]|nr:hypothetical protein [Pelagibaculum spongiae]
MARNPVSATIHVWLSYDPFGKGHSLLGNIGAYGHAAMQLSDSSCKAFTNNYLSWWPEGSAGRSSILPGKKFSAQKITSI